MRHSPHSQAEQEVQGTHCQLEQKPECDVGGLWEVCHSDGLGSQKPRKAAAIWGLHGTVQLENPVEEKNTIPTLTWNLRKQGQRGALLTCGAFK